MQQNVQKVGDKLAQFVKDKRFSANFNQLQKSYQEVIKHKNHLAGNLKKRGVSKGPDEIMAEIQIRHYYPLHL